MAENNVGSRVVQQIRRDEVTGNITSMPIHEDVITSTNKSVIALREICDEWKRVKVKDENDKPLTEVFSIEEITDKSKYFVDYDYSNVYFHIDVAGKLMKLDYYGIGSEYLSYTAVFTKLDKYGNVIETLADIIDGGKEIIETVKIFGGVTNVLQTLKNMADQIASGTVKPNPIVRGQDSSCRFCDYRDVCHMDLCDRDVRTMASTSAEKFWEKLKQEDDRHG